MKASFDSELNASKRSKRSRAVRLTPDGVTTLERQLEDRWQAEYPHERLTRPLRAELLGLSVRTADRLLGGEPIDRSSVATAFARVGCEIEPRFVLEPEPESPEEESQTVPDGYSNGVEGPTNLSFSGPLASTESSTNGQTRLDISTQDLEDLGDLPSHLAASFLKADHEASTPTLVLKESGSNSLPRSQTSSSKAFGDQRLVWALAVVAIVSVLGAVAMTTDRGEYSMTSRKFRDSIQDTLELGHKAYQKGEYTKAEQYFLQVIEKNQTARDISYSADAKRGLAEIELYRANYAKALKYVNEAIALQSEFVAENPFGPLYLIRAQALMKMGDLAGAERSFRSAIAMFGRVKDPLGVALAQGDLGEFFTQTGRLTDAETEISSSLKWLEFNKRPREIAATKILLSQLRDKQGKVEEAIILAKDAQEYFNKEGHQRWMAKSHLVLGLALAHAKRRSEAKECLVTAEKLYKAVGDPEGTRTATNASNRL